MTLNAEVRKIKEVKKGKAKKVRRGGAALGQSLPEKTLLIKIKETQKTLLRRKTLRINFIAFGIHEDEKFCQKKN